MSRGREEERSARVKEKGEREERLGEEISLSPLRAHMCAGKRRREGKGGKSPSPLPHVGKRREKEGK